MYTPSSKELVATAAPVAAQIIARGYFSAPGSGNPEDTIRKWSSFIGIVTAIVGNILISFALNIQRYAHIKIHKEEEEKRRQARKLARRTRSYGGTNTNGSQRRPSLAHKNSSQSANEPLTHSFSSSSSGEHAPVKEPPNSYLRSPYWWFGITLMTIGETGNFLAYGFAPASIVSPLGVVALISNCIIAPLLLHEAFRLRDFWGVLVAVGGAVTVVLSAKTEERRLGPHEVWKAITHLEFLVYMIVTAVLIAMLVWASPRYGSRTILIDLGLVGLFGGYTALSTKGVASMLTNGVGKALATPVTYSLLAVLVGTAIMQIKYVNKALQRFDSTQVIPVQFVMFTLSVIIGSAILYRDFEHTTPDRATKFVIGCLLTFFGVFLITSGRPHQDEHHDESETEDERISLATQSHQSSPNTTNGYSSNIPYQDEPSPLKQSTDPINPSPLQREILQPPTPSCPSDSETDTATEHFPDLSRRSSKVSWAQLTPSPSRQCPLGHGPPSLRLTSAPGSFPTESSPLIDFDTPTRPPINRLASQNAELGRQSDTALPAAIHVQNAANGNENGATTMAAAAPATPIRERVAGVVSSSIGLPGPFISPLSSSLAVVVADSLRRGTDIYGSRRRPRLTSLHRTRSHGYGTVGRQGDGSDEDEAPQRPRTRPGSPRKRSVAREREAYSRSLEEGGLLGVRPRAKSLGHRISQFFGVGGSNGNTRRPGRSGDANGGSHNVESSPVRSADAEEERTRRRESAVGDDEV